MTPALFLFRDHPDDFSKLPHLKFIYINESSREDEGFFLSLRSN